MKGRCLQQRGIRAILSQRVRPKDAIDLAKQAGVVYKIPHGGGKVFIGGGGRPTQERIKNTTGISDPPTIEEV